MASPSLNIGRADFGVSQNEIEQCKRSKEDAILLHSNLGVSDQLRSG